MIKLGMIQKIKNMFSKTSKKTFGKLGLFLIFWISILGTFSLSVNMVSGADNEGYTEAFMESSLNIDQGNVYNLRAEKPATADGKIDTPEVTSNNILIDWVLEAILMVLKTLLGYAGSFLDVLLKQSFFDKFIGEANSNIYKGWAIVRDILNMFFMLLLLFSAFATVFQVEKYHLRKVIIMLIVMALLVNFSYPITLFVIDFSNSAMYFLIESTVPSSESLTANIAGFSHFGDVLEKTNDASKPTTVQLFLNIIFHFILFVTFISIALNLLIRFLAFAILIILSPAGFTFAFFPDTKNIASDWWSALFKYAFMGPIMVFFLYLSVLLFSDSKLSSDASVIGSTMAFSIPIAFLWMGLIASQKFGGSGAGVAMGMAKKVGNNIKNYGQKAAWGAAGIVGKGIDAGTGHRISGGVGGLKSKWNSFGENYKSASERRKTEAADFLGVDGANEKLVRENMKRMKDEGVSNAELTRLQGGTRAERMATALFRAENNRFDNDPATAQTQYNAAMNAVRGHQVYENQFLGGARKTNMDLVINERITTAGATTPAAIQPIIREELNRLDPDQWKDQNIQRMVANTTPNRGYIITEGANVISGYSQQGQDNVTRNMRGAKLNAGSQGRNNMVGFWA